MRRAALILINAVLLCDAIFAQSNSDRAHSTQTTLKVAYWNIQWFPGRRPRARLGEQKRQIESVHHDLAKIDADIIAMEEVRDFAHAGIAVQSLPGFKVDVCSNFSPREGQNVSQQVAITSRLQPMSAWVEIWKSGRKVLPPRGFAFAVYEVAPKRLLLVYALHLKSNRGTLRENIAMREESIRQLTAHMQSMQRVYGNLGQLMWIIGGDFNTSPDNPKLAGEKTIRQLIDQGFGWVWQNVPLAQRYTRLPSRLYPPACDDHILYRAVTLHRAFVINTSAQSSDHRAIAAVFDLTAR
jgi:endonuclease/exonuclease/phosphatase family metal-dependent hydrolase